ncbi:MAG: DUF4286 family protein [Tahibacter sp.]
MIVYEVNIRVAASIAVDYAAWLAAHVAEIRRLPGFVDARVFAVEEMPPPESDAEQRLCVHYHLQDRAALQRYLREDAPRLRRDGVERFADQVHVHRRVLEPRD